MDEFISKGVRIYSSVTVTGLHQHLTGTTCHLVLQVHSNNNIVLFSEMSPFIRDEDGSPYWMFPMILSLIYEVNSTDIPEYQRICWLDENGMYTNCQLVFLKK